VPDFCHLHSHTQYSLLDGAADISSLMDKAVKEEMKAIAIHRSREHVWLFLSL
jgi:DNA polymerase-3 subunit alpha